MPYINRFFDKVFVISMKDSERRKYIVKTFNELGVDFEFYDAVRGNELSEHKINSIYDEEAAANHKSSSWSLSKTQLGCALSHLNICKKIKKEKFERVLIFEDDVKPINRHFTEVQEVFKELPSDWDLLYLGVKTQEKPPPYFKLKLLFYYPLTHILLSKTNQWKYSELWRLYPKSYSRHLKIAGYHHGSHAYGITLEGARKLLKKHQKLTAPYDILLGQSIVEEVIKGYLVKNKMFKQNMEFDSQIDFTWIPPEERKKKKNIIHKLKSIFK